MADPGFPVGGVPSHWRGADLQCGCFSVKTYAKMKELDPVGGGGQAPVASPLDPPMIEAESSVKILGKTQAARNL